MKHSATIIVHVVPRARKTELAGHHGDAIRIRLAAPPVEGAANDALIRFLSTLLDLPRSAITIVRGATGRRKVVSIDGLTIDAVRRQLLADSQ